MDSTANKSFEALTAAQLRQVLNKVNNPVIVHDFSGAVVEVNTQCLQLFGIDRDQALSLKVPFDLVDSQVTPEELDSTFARLRAGL